MNAIITKQMRTHLLEKHTGRKILRYSAVDGWMVGDTFYTDAEVISEMNSISEMQQELPPFDWSFLDDPSLYHAW